MPHPQWKIEELQPEIESIRQRVLQVSAGLNQYFVEKQELIELMIISMIAQEPLLIVGAPGTAKSDLIIKFCQAIGVSGTDYFEYMLTKFSEPSEILGPVDINEMRQGAYVRRIEGKLPTAKIAFLDEIFKSNSAILNTLLTVINERKFYQDGRPQKIPLRMLFAATNEIPEFSELHALRDRFTLKIESSSVRESHFDELILRGLRNDTYHQLGQRPWADLASLEDFEKLHVYLEHRIRRSVETEDLRDRAFPPTEYALFRRILRTLEREDNVVVSDRKVIKLFKLIQIRAFVLRGGVVNREDLTLLSYIADRLVDFDPVSKKVRTLLHIRR